MREEAKHSLISPSLQVTHGCIIATLKLYLPDGKEAKASPSIVNTTSGSSIPAQVWTRDRTRGEIKYVSAAGSVSAKSVYPGISGQGAATREQNFRFVIIIHLAAAAG